MGERACGHGEVEFPTSWSPDRSVQVGSHGGLVRPERD